MRVKPVIGCRRESIKEAEYGMVDCFNFRSIDERSGGI